MPTSEIINYASGGVRVVATYSGNNTVTSVDCISTLATPTRARAELTNGTAYEITIAPNITTTVVVPRNALSITFTPEGDPHVQGLGSVAFWSV